MYQDFLNKNDDYLNDFKQKVANQKIATVEERRSELARSRNNFLGTFAGITLAGLVGWFVLAPQYANTSKEIPVIHRPQTAVKIKPENSGGMDIPNQDKDVYNIIEKKNVDNTVVENLLPTPEAPKLPDIVPDVSDVNANNLDEIVDNVVEPSKSEAENVKKVEDSALPNKPTDLFDAKSADTVSEKVAKVETPKVAETPKIEPKKVEQPKTQTIANNGNWQIQLIASKNKDAVEKAWTTLSTKYSGLKAYTHEVQSSDLGSQGMFYRLRAGSFASKEEAVQACAKLKAQGLTDCISKER